MTGLARAGKTAFLTSVAANLLALGAGRPALPKLLARLGGRLPSVGTAPAGAAALPRFDVTSHLDALARDPPTWPVRTDAASLLALDIVLPREGLFAALPAQQTRIELLDYPGEWLLDLPLLRRRLRNLVRDDAAPARDLDRKPPSSSLSPPRCRRRRRPTRRLAATGHRLYRDLLRRLRDEAGLALLQPGRFLMPAPGPEPAWMAFFPASRPRAG